MSEMMKTVAGRVLALSMALMLAFGVGFPALAQSGIVPADRQAWDVYSNEKFGVSARFPRYGFIAQPQVNDFGQTYLSEEGQVIITAFASYWNLNTTEFSIYREQQRQVLESSGASITYAPGGNSWFVYSGFLGNDIFYFKSTINAGCPIAGHIYFKFPAVLKDQMSSIIEYMEDRLVLGASDVCPAG